MADNQTTKLLPCPICKGQVRWSGGKICCSCGLEFFHCSYEITNRKWNERAELHERIVRCKDCEYYVDASPQSTRYRIKGPRCLLFSDNKVVSVKPDGYCAWGKRKEVTR